MKLGFAITCLIALVVAISMWILAVVGSAPIEIVFYLLFGWIVFLRHNIAHGNYSAIATAEGLIAIVLLMISMHWACGWLTSQWNSRRAISAPQTNGFFWRMRHSLFLVAMIVAIFAIGTATIGCAYDVYWLSTGTDPLLTYYGVSGPGNKLKQITLAALNHESAKQRFPAGCVVDGTGQLLHGWMVQLLPYLEQADLYPKIDLRQAWNSEANSPHFRQSIYEFINPKYGGELVANGYAATNFSSNVHVIGGDRSMKYGDITDGTSKTLLFGEAGGDFQAWGSPTNWRDPIQGLNRFPSGFGSPQHDRSTCFAFADNSIRYLSETIDPQVLRALATPNGGEQLSESEYGELLP